MDAQFVTQEAQSSLCLEMDGTYLILGNSSLNLDNRIMRPSHANKVDSRMRRFIPNARERLDLMKDVKELRAIFERAQSGEISDDVASSLQAPLIYRVMEKSTMERVVYAAKRGKNCVMHPCDTLQGARAALGSEFEELVPRRWSDESIELLSTSVYEASHITGRGYMSSMEVTLLVIMRLSHQEKTFNSLGRVFGRDQSDLSAHFNRALLKASDKFSRLIDFSLTAKPFAGRLGASYMDASNRIVEEKAQPGSEPVPGMGDYAFVADGLRRHCPRSKDDAKQQRNYSGYDCRHGELIGLVVTPCGLVAGVTKVHPGSSSDLAFQNELIAALISAGAPGTAKTLVDGIFSRIEGVLDPIPDTNMRAHMNLTDQSCAAYSSFRIIVEWTIRLLKLYFPYAFEAKKMKESTSRVRILHLAILMFNFQTCMHGNQLSLYTELYPLNEPDAKQCLLRYLSLLDE
jgi:hypothetical protein